MRIISTVFIVVFVMCSLLAEPPSVTIQSTDKPPKIDGVLFDQCWKNAEPLKNFSLDYPPRGHVTAAQAAGRERYVSPDKKDSIWT